jgi:hypothetical protein
MTPPRSGPGALRPAPITRTATAGTAVPARRQSVLSSR